MPNKSFLYEFSYVTFMLLPVMCFQTRKHGDILDTQYILFSKVLIRSYFFNSNRGIKIFSNKYCFASKDLYDLNGNFKLFFLQNIIYVSFIFFLVKQYILL